MTRKEQKEMLTAMREKFILISQSSGTELGFILAQVFGKGWYDSHKKRNEKSV